MKLSKKNKMIISISCLLLCIVVVSILYFIKGNLIKEHKVCDATIINCSWKSRGTARYIVEGVFEINNNIYNTSCQLKCQDLNLSKLKEKLINLKVKAIYNQKYPSVNYLLIEKSSYDLYDISMPDSLIWLDEFVNCK